MPNICNQPASEFCKQCKEIDCPREEYNPKTTYAIASNSVWYKGRKYRSQGEADTALSLDSMDLNWFYQYETYSLLTPKGTKKIRFDFSLTETNPQIDTMINAQLDADVKKLALVNPVTPHSPEIKCIVEVKDFCNKRCLAGLKVYEDQRVILGLPIVIIATKKGWELLSQYLERML